MSRAGCDFAWGAAGAAALAEEGCRLFAVVDLLPFTTAVSVAAERAMAVVPADLSQARPVAERLGLPVAAGRHERPAPTWSLSPVALATGPAVPRLVVGSPNGGAVSAWLAERGCRVVASSLRNLSATARWLASSDEPVAVVAAGERWGDGSLRRRSRTSSGPPASSSRFLERSAR